MIARVLPDQAAGRLLDYRVPECFGDSVGVGSRVKVPVRTRMLTATVVEMLDFSDIRGLRDIAELLDEKPMIRPALLDLARWMADYYCCPVETAICSVLPVAVRDGRVSEKRRNTVRVAREVTEEEITALEKRAPRQADALRAVIEAGAPVPVAAAAAEAGV
ncbi:MAG: primosomal protein N', partial [Verrucomicrobiota bacterium]